MTTIENAKTARIRDLMPGTSRMSTVNMTGTEQAAFMWLVHSMLAGATEILHGYRSPQVVAHSQRAQVWARRYAAGRQMSTPVSPGSSPR